MEGASAEESGARMMLVDRDGSNMVAMVNVAESILSV